MDNKIKYFGSMIFNRKVWRTVFGPHKLTIPKQGNDSNQKHIQHEYEFKLSENYLNEWNELFQTTKSEFVIPYAFYWPWLMKFLMEDLLYDLGLNLRYVYHIGQEAEFTGKYDFGKNAAYINKNSLVDLCPMRKDRLMIVTETTVEKKTGGIIFKSIDYVIVQNIPGEQMASLTTSESWNKTPLTFLESGFRKREPLFSDPKKAGNIASYYCPKNLWLKFGFVSGAISITHGFWLISRYFRGEEPFMQGMCSGNIALKLLSHDLGQKFRKFNIFFNNKLFFPQTVELRCDENHFELYDEKENMVAFGSRSSTTPLKAQVKEEARAV